MKGGTIFFLRKLLNQAKSTLEAPCKEKASTTAWVSSVRQASGSRSFKGLRDYHEHEAEKYMCIPINPSFGVKGRSDDDESLSGLFGSAMAPSSNKSQLSGEGVQGLRSKGSGKSGAAGFTEEGRERGSEGPSSFSGNEVVPGAKKLALLDIDSKYLIVKHTPNLKPLPDFSSIRFGSCYTDHMLVIEWRADQGWSTPIIKPLAPLPIHPCAQILHYGMGCFEGMKAYKSADGQIRMFRADQNMNRLERSASRLNLPSFEKAQLLSCIKSLLRTDERWFPPPTPEGFSVYIRPTLVATTPSLGVGPPSEALFFCVLSPAGPYFPGGGLAPIRLLLDSRHVRAYPGGMGDFKAAGNYAPTILPQTMGARHGCSQILYVLRDTKPSRILQMPGEESKSGMEDMDGGDGIVGESGAMNVFFLIKKKEARGGMELATPRLDGLILPGITRDSVLALAASWGEFKVSERVICLRELEEAHEEGRLLEAFGTGTAVVISPISGLVREDGSEMAIPFDASACRHWTSKPPGSSATKPAASEPVSLCGRLFRALSDIHYGSVPHAWSTLVE